MTKVLMLGWEYPPHIAGGLGTACEGLTRALARQGVEIIFAMPYVYGDETAPHMKLLDPSQARDDAIAAASAERAAQLVEALAKVSAGGGQSAEEWYVKFGVPAFLMPYWTVAEYAQHLEQAMAAEAAAGAAAQSAGLSTADAERLETEPPMPHRPRYGTDIFGEVANFTRGIVAAARHYDFDAIHAHDWMTYPAGVALRELTGKPLVVHVHSLEYDRSGHHVNPGIHEAERYGVTHADAVIAVSHYTKSVIRREHGVHHDKIHVVHNGIYPKEVLYHYRAKHPDWGNHMVLFLGRVTFQKGPDYFVRAAAKVVPHVDDVKFVLAGSGDMLDQVKHLAYELGVHEHFVFPGFLRGKAVEEMFSMADLYVMPSVSEPFGIAALEAINFTVPALISRQSGVSEVVDHSLKFDFWDVNRLADLIINGLVHEELRADMVEMARKELGKLRWDASATKTISVYNHVIN